MDQNIILNKIKECEIKQFINIVFPPIPQEEMTNFISQLVEQADEKCKQLAKEDPIQKYVKEIYIQLHKDAFDAGLTAELAEFYLDNPDLDILELNRQFRLEWDI